MSFKKVLDHTSNFWKPEEKGDSISGKLLLVSTGQNGQVLHLEGAEGTVQVGVSTVLQNVAWENYLGKMVKITFFGTEVSKTGRTYMTFDVDVEA